MKSVCVVAVSTVCNKYGLYIDATYVLARYVLINYIVCPPQLSVYCNIPTCFLTSFGPSSDNYVKLPKQTNLFTKVYFVSDISHLQLFICLFISFCGHCIFYFFSKIINC